MSEDVLARAAPFLAQCGACDAGLPMGCTCPTSDFRPVMLELVREVERLREVELDHVRPRYRVKSGAHEGRVGRRVSVEVKARWKFYAPYAFEPAQDGYNAVRRLTQEVATEIGQQQCAVLLRARSAPGGMVMPANFLERRACKRLEARHPALLRRALGFPDVWLITHEGKTAWLKVLQ